ncbi:phage regulatory CII family protein [Acetobacter fallax]|uniref:Uncharacterized protein n=1 Tax=Acetobacter fallax TaxID=1737473 RepID=A0ABX0KA59_9PROT|nr:hypothetical protein [Acetobacter fallax]NHO33295.1 hypothetical protein [Acetobacter fallax]NHO36916.1 hypothetical protein [Acetobacter fallax]
MTGRRINAATQLSLLDWEPPSPIREFDERMVRGNTFEARLSRAISVSLEGCGRSRDVIAEMMSVRIGRPISVNILNAYASPMRDTHTISVPRFDALVFATGDQRLLEFLAAPHDMAVVSRRMLPMIQLAETQAKKRELSRMERSLQRAAWKGSPCT